MSSWNGVFLIFCLMQVIASGTFYSVAVADSSKASELNFVALTFMEKVANIKLDAYNITYDYKGLPLSISSSLYPGHTEARIYLNLTSTSSQLKIKIKFIDWYPVFYQLRSENGPPVLSFDEPSDVFDMTRGILKRYQLVFNATYCSQLVAMIDQITYTDQEQTIGTDCATLTFDPNTSLGRNVGFVWRYKGTIKKHLNVAINKGGFLEFFGDTWGIYKISNAELNMSEETAVRTASDRAQAYIDELGAKVAKVKVELRYVNSQENPRGEDCFVLYPVWFVKLVFDRPYGDGHYINEYLVTIWADTGEVRTALPQGYWGGPPPDSEETSNTSTLVVIPLIVVIGAIILTVRTRKKNKKDQT
jgi:hypothetical protein